MAPQNPDKLKKVLLWVNERLDEDPSLTVPKTFRKAEVHFDLSPKECEFIERNFARGKQ